DGSFATSGFPLHGKLKKELMDADDPSELALFLFAPADGWLLCRQNGTMAYERLPTGLDFLLKRRTRLDSPIAQITISGFGGWFVRFADGECEWEAIPKALESVLIAHIRHADPNLVVALSPSDGLSYFIIVGEHAEWVHDSSALRSALEYAQTDPNDSKVLLPETVTFTFPGTTPPSSD
ncbi:hypothetical protein HDU91_003532, partial [Kappamyces sp. JEL0680]